tara:strand:- start:79 stop:627 length:549 start_codon:yes stop_codon:yes gene_type:complete
MNFYSSQFLNSFDISQILNPFDIAFLITIFISFFFGIKNGLTRSILNFIKWIIIFYLIQNCFTFLRPIFDLYISSQSLSDILIFLTTLIVSYILISFINRLIIGVLQPKKSFLVDMSFGAVLGVLRGYLIFTLLIFFINSNFSSRSLPQFLYFGYFQEIINSGTDLLKQLPRNIDKIQNLDL